MEPEFKNDREILLAVWADQQTMKKNMLTHQEQASKFQAETRQDINLLKIDVGILKGRKSTKFSFSNAFKTLLGIFGIYR